MTKVVGTYTGETKILHDKSVIKYWMSCEEVNGSVGANLRGLLSVAAGGTCKDPIESGKPIRGKLNINTFSLNPSSSENGFDCRDCPVMANCDQIPDYVYGWFVKK